MSALVFTNARAYFGALDLSGITNKIALGLDADAVDVTTLADGTKVNQGGLKIPSLGMAGFVDLADDGGDETLFNAVALAGVPVTVVPEGLTVGNLAYILPSLLCEYQPGAAHGQALAFDAKAYATDDMVRGVLAATGSKSATGVGTAIQLGALSSTQTLVAALHVLTAAGTTPSITAKIQSDDNSGFTSATDRATFGALGVPGYEIKEVAGAVTDDWWRVVWTLSGTGPVFGIRAAFGIK